MNKITYMCFYILGVLSCLVFFAFSSFLLKNGILERASQMDEVAIAESGGEFHFKNNKYEYILHGELPIGVNVEMLKKAMDTSRR